MIFQSKYPTGFDIVGMCFALLGAVVMTVDFTMLFKDKNTDDEHIEEETCYSSKESNMTYRTQHTDWTVRSHLLPLM